MRKLKNILCLILTVIIVVNCLSFGSEAAAKKKIINTFITEKSSVKNIMKKAPDVKVGTNTVQMKKKRTCFVKFTAKKGKYYKFSFTPQFTKKQNADFMLGYFQISRDKNGYLSTQDLPTWGGTYYALNIGNKKYINAIEPASDKAQRYRTKRSTTLWLDKGETVYISSYFQKNTAPTYIKYSLSIK